ncbi:hypothetical protein BDL97_13G105500 [Sphagnum fallax]|nr:hypothetical protein BDL97_13G105500 [Sphagnum fallax]
MFFAIEVFPSIGSLTEELEIMQKFSVVIWSCTWRKQEVHTKDSWLFHARCIHNQMWIENHGTAACNTCERWTQNQWILCIVALPNY